ncbi:hypothetical protein ABK040_016358 [Willaertia magna]
MSSILCTIKTSLKTIKVPKGSNLRTVLLENNIPLYNGKSQTFNCGGIGTCGTCACQVKALNSDNVAEIKDEKPKTMQRGSAEELRLKLPPHFNKNDKIRLACQCIVNEDVIVEKFEGFCGHQYDKLKW